MECLPSSGFRGLHSVGFITYYHRDRGDVTLLRGNLTIGYQGEDGFPIQFIGFHLLQRLFTSHDFLSYPRPRTRLQHVLWLSEVRCKLTRSLTASFFTVITKIFFWERFLPLPKLKIEKIIKSSCFNFLLSVISNF